MTGGVFFEFLQEGEQTPDPVVEENGELGDVRGGIAGGGAEWCFQIHCTSLLARAVWRAGLERFGSPSAGTRWRDGSIVREKTKPP